MSRDVDTAVAFVPGHITGFFSAHPHEDPLRAGSRGAGLTLTDGVTVRVRPSDRTVLRLDGESIDVEPVGRLVDALDVAAELTVESDLPMGAGFGVSGAVTLGTALAANHVFDCGRSENELIALAHRAEVESGTGLGDVVAQARGGIPIRLEPGAPDHNRLDGIPTATRVEYVSLGTLSTEAVLAGDTERITAAGDRALATLRERPTLESFMRASQRFAIESGLCTESIADIIDDVLAVDGSAAMAMLGQTVFAIGSGLTEAGYDAEACRTHDAGATIRP